MFIVIYVVLFICLIESIRDQSPLSNAMHIFAFVSALVFYTGFVFVYNVNFGDDYVQYMYWYDSARLSSLEKGEMSDEAFARTLNLLSSVIKSPVLGLNLIILGSIGLLIIGASRIPPSGRCGYLAVMVVLLLTNRMFLEQSVNTIRSGAAIAVFFAAFALLVNQKKVLAIFLFALAIAFHVPITIICTLLSIAAIFLTKMPRKYWLILLTMATFLLLFGGSIFHPSAISYDHHSFILREIGAGFTYQADPDHQLSASLAIQIILYVVIPLYILLNDRKFLNESPPMVRSFILVLGLVFVGFWNYFPYGVVRLCPALFAFLGMALAGVANVRILQAYLTLYFAVNGVGLYRGINQ